MIFRLKLDAGGKPSTWLPPGRLVELFVYFPKLEASGWLALASLCFKPRDN